MADKKKDDKGGEKKDGEKKEGEEEDEKEPEEPFCDKVAAGIVVVVKVGPFDSRSSTSQS
jgi:hypothetical protein